jgi:copper transport protein
MSAAARLAGRSPVRSRSVRLALAVVGALMVIVLSATPASAHVELADSQPPNVGTAPGPLAEIRLTFTGAADAVRDRFELRDAASANVPIASIENDGESVLVVRPESPLTSGRSRLTWAIRSGDSHTMTGSITFTVAPASEAGSAPTRPAEITEAEAGATGTETSSTKGTADHLATLSRWLVFAALFLSVGGLAYLTWVHRGSEAEGRRLVFYVRRAAVVVVVASVVEWIAQLVAAAGGDLWAPFSVSDWREMAGSGFGTGSLLRLVGGALVLSCLRIDHEDGVWSSDLEPDLSSDRPSPSGGVGVAARPAATLSRLRVEASPLAFVGAGALVLSEAFIGHTATVQPRVVVLLADAVHLLAGAAWVAGGLMLALTLHRRHRRRLPLDARLLATRFSALATWALIGVAVTGVAMAWSILRTPSALWGTEFGRLLLVKLALVAVVAGIGAHHHLTLVPTLSDGDDEPAHRFRRFLAVEVGLFAAVLLVTALLVVADPT